jgi:isopropylmalate/homocitrate/citramalate synthase
MGDRRGGAVTANAENVWTGSLNDPHAIGGSVGLYDTTLRDGEQTVGVVLSPDEKLRIAKALDGLGVGRIEAGFPRVSPEDADAVGRILAAGLRAEVWGFSRALTDDVDALLQLGVEAAVIESPVSEGKLAAYGLDRDEVVRRIRTAVAYAAERGVRVAFFGVDGTRADLHFLERVYAAAREAGAAEAVVVDTIGVAAPEAVEELVGRVGAWVGPDVPLHFHGHNDFGLATAAAAAAVRGGATWIHGTVNGMGERAGNANLLEVALTLEALYGVETGLRLERAREAAELVRSLSGYELEPWKPLVGENLFTRESGAVASQFHDPPAIEPYAAALVGADRRVVLGKKSGLDNIRLKCDELGVHLPEEARRELLKRVKALATEKRGLVTDDEFRTLAADLHQD